jgi:PAS domain S-box-containing protein
MVGRVAEGELKQAVEAVAFPPLIAWDRDGNIRLANKSAADALGLPLGELVGKPLIDLAGPADEVQRTITDFLEGRFAAVHTHRRIHRRSGEDIPVFATSRAVEVDGQMAGLSAFVPENEAGRAGRNPLRTWLDLVPVAVGCTDSDWNIVMVSTEIRDLIDRTSAEVVGRSLLGLVDPEDVDDLRGSVAEQEEPRSLPRIRFVLPNGEETDVCVLLAPRPETTPGTRFALVGRIESYYPQPVDRVADLELRLRRIGAEVRAAGLIDSAAMPILQNHPELSDLSTRQWEILSRLLEGVRVPTIANELYISPSTVRNHLSMIFQRFGVHSQAELLEKLRSPESG